jgi:transcriptional regulator with XRE-family HTH domain
MSNRTDDFGQLLKHWRNVRKESQLALACVAGVSAKHVAFVETGRARPSRDMVLTLAQALDVPLRERNVLLRAAGFADAYAESSLDAPAIGAARRALDFLLSRHEPYPAMVIDTAWNLHLANRAARTLLGAFSRQTRSTTPPNVLRILFDPAGMRPFVSNLPEIGSHLLRRLQREAIGTADDGPVRQLIADLLARPENAALLATPHPARVDARLPVIPLVLERDGLRVGLHSLVSAFGTAVDLTLSDLRIETLLPVDERTERVLRQLARGDSSTPRGRQPIPRG